VNGVVVAVVLVGGVVIAYVANRIADSVGSSTSSTEPAVDPAPGDADEDPGTDVDTPSGPAYALTAEGVTDFLAAYRQKFGTSLVVDLALYGDYAIVDVPVPGKARQAGWLYRNGSGWTSFGGVRATFPGSSVVNTRRLDVDALMRTVVRARRTLGVERPAQAYVIVRFIPRIEDAPSVDIHVTNSFQESGYLATRLDGTVERAYPYTR
jgi:hypothetical protein